MLGQSRSYLCVGIAGINRIHHLLRYDPDQPWAGTRKLRHPVQKGPSLGSGCCPCYQLHRETLPLDAQQ